MAIFVHLVVTPHASPCYGHKTRLRRSNLRFACAGPPKMLRGRSKFAFRLREHPVGLFSLRKATQNASPEVKICVSPARNTPADLGRTVFPVQGRAKRVSGGQNLRFACAGAQNRMIRMLRHESETWILQKLRRYKDAETWIGDMDLAEDPEIHMDAYIRIRRHGSCRGS